MAHNKSCNQLNLGARSGIRQFAVESNGSSPSLASLQPEPNVLGSLRGIAYYALSKVRRYVASQSAPQRGQIAATKYRVLRRKAALLLALGHSKENL